MTNTKPRRKPMDDPPEKETPKKKAGAKKAAPRSRATTEPREKYPPWFEKYKHMAKNTTEVERNRLFVLVSIVREDFIEQAYLGRQSVVDMTTVLESLRERVASIEEILLNRAEAPQSATTAERRPFPTVDEVLPPPQGQQRPAPAPAEPPAPPTLARTPVAGGGITERDMEGWYWAVHEELAPPPQAGDDGRPFSLAHDMLIRTAMEHYSRHCEPLGQATSKPVAWIVGRVEKLAGAEDPELRSQSAEYIDEPPPPPPVV